jgi:hypothetical protein
MCGYPWPRHSLSKWYHPLVRFTDEDALSASATLALRTLIQLNPGEYAKYIYLLAQSLEEIHSSSARAEIIWLVGEYASQLGGRAADILRLSVQDFAEQVFPILIFLTTGRWCKVSNYHIGSESVRLILPNYPHRHRLS